MTTKLSKDDTANLIAEFCGTAIDYYDYQFKRIDDSDGWSVSFNWAAAIFGPLWMAVRGMWGYFWIFLIVELITLVQFCKGFWNNLGVTQFERAAAIAERADQRYEQAAVAAAEGASNAGLLADAALKLKEGAASAFAVAETTAATSSYYIVGGLLGFLLVKSVIGLTANWALEQRYMKWRANRSIAHGFNMTKATALGVFLVIVYAMTAVRFATNGGPSFLYSFPAQEAWNINLSNFLDGVFVFITSVGKPFFYTITNSLRVSLDGLEAVLVGTPWPIVMSLTVLTAWRTGGPRAAIFTAAALAYLGVFGFWEKSMVTVSLLGTAAVLCVLFGLPLGIWCGKNERVYSLVRPILDLMQTMPAFVYLIPVIAFFGVGRPPGVLATIIFGMPPVVRLTALGIQGVPDAIKEAATAFGASKRYLLFKVEIPLALPSIMTGINQTILMCLSMVVIASLIGAKGLGEDVLIALQYAAEGQGIMAGVAILFCAMILDRIVQGRGSRA
ncbi:MAG: ABC transporter permease subunit [Paracoccaceae bacterium]